jgi:hypothetical protein
MFRPIRMDHTNCLQVAIKTLLLLLQASSSGNVSMIQSLLSVTGAQSYIKYTDGLGRTSLFKTVSNGHIPIVDHLMEARCIINLADREGHAAIVSQLITARCNVDIPKTDGTTPLFIAAIHGHVAVVVHLITARCNVNLARTDGVTPFLMVIVKGYRDVVKKLIVTRCDVNLRCGHCSQNVSLTFSMVSRSPCPPNLRPCLRTVHPIKYHSVSFSDVFIGEFCTLCPTRRHVHSKHRATDPDFIYDNDGTKPSPSSVLDYFIKDNSCHYQQWRSDFDTNQDFKTDFRKNNPAFKKENPGLRWCTTLDSATRSNTQDNRQIVIPSVTLAAEATTFLCLIKKTGHHTQQVGPVIDSGASHHTGNCHRDVLTFLPTSFLMYPAIGPPVTMPAVLLGVQIMTHAGTTHLLPLPGPGVYDPSVSFRWHNFWRQVII